MKKGQDMTKPRSNLMALNEYLFEMMDAISNEDLQGEALQQELSRTELDAFLESGEEFAELDLFNYSKLYACERYLQIVRRSPCYRDSVEVICRKQHISIDTRTMLKDCLLRTLFYQNQNDNFCLRRKQQTIDAVPVVYGHWKDVWDNGISSKAVCSKCLKVSKRPVGQFCRWCGAHMKEGEGHEP